MMRQAIWYLSSLISHKNGENVGCRINQIDHLIAAITDPCLSNYMIYWCSEDDPPLISTTAPLPPMDSRRFFYSDRTVTITKLLLVFKVHLGTLVTAVLRPGKSLAGAENAM